MLSPQPLCRIVDITGLVLDEAALSATLEYDLKEQEMQTCKLVCVCVCVCVRVCVHAMLF